MTVSLYPPIVLQRDLSPDHGGAKVDELCEAIHKATKGWGVSHSWIVDGIEGISRNVSCVH